MKFITLLSLGLFQISLETLRDCIATDNEARGNGGSSETLLCLDCLGELRVLFSTPHNLPTQLRRDIRSAHP